MSVFTREKAGLEYSAYGNKSSHCSEESISVVSWTLGGITTGPSASVGLQGATNSLPTDTVTNLGDHSLPTSPTVTHCTPEVTTIFKQTTLQGTLATISYISTIAHPTASDDGCASTSSVLDAQQHISIAAIAGGVIGGVGGVIALILIYIYCMRGQHWSKLGFASIASTLGGFANTSNIPHSHTQRNGQLLNLTDEQGKLVFSVQHLYNSPDPPVNVQPSDPLGHPVIVPSTKSIQQHSTAPNSAASGSSNNWEPCPNSNPEHTAHHRGDPRHHTRRAQLELAPLIAAMNAFEAARPVIQEDDAGRLTGGGIRIPPAYQRQWTHSSERPGLPS